MLFCKYLYNYNESYEHKSIKKGIITFTVSDGEAAVSETITITVENTISSGIITTIAGNPETIYGGFAGDDGPAALADFYDPDGLAVDREGNIYIADTRNHRIRKIDSAGNIDTIAGTGEAGYSGDGGPAASAKLDYPEDIAVDSAGNLYIADTNNCVIRRINQSGIIETVVGTGEDGSSSDGGPAVNAQISYPRGIALDNEDNLYITTDYYIVRKVNQLGNISTITATHGLLYAPEGLCTDAQGNLYIADYYNHVVRKVDTGGNISIVAGREGVHGYTGDGEPASDALLWFPADVAVDKSGNLYITDSSNCVVRKVTPDGNIGTVVGSGDYGHTGDGGPAAEASLREPNEVAVHAAGRIYILDISNDVVRMVE